MENADQPRFRSLDRAEIDALLARNHVGRLAYAHGRRVEVQPVHYVYADGWLYGRTSEGAKVEAIGQGWWPVAFEVDEVDDLFRWRSVVVHGGFYMIPAEGAEWEMKEREKAIHLLRSLIPETFTETDPTPFRSLLFRIAVQEASGREAVPPDDASHA
jgi:nitroimidazol reductase NimA-like FMN-containing flavoprotein (pyridoxamine 5'-phosphate oxidase superfamily)